MTDASMAPLFAVRSASEMRLEFAGFPVDGLNLGDHGVSVSRLSCRGGGDSRHSARQNIPHLSVRNMIIFRDEGALFDARPERSKGQQPVAII